jgi:hypothetical protein
MRKVTLTSEDEGVKILMLTGIAEYFSREGYHVVVRIGEAGTASTRLTRAVLGTMRVS